MLPSASVQQAFALALEHHQAGRLAEAEALYRQILAVQPAHAEALHLSGVIAHQSGRHELALDMIRQALALDPHSVAAESNLGEVHRALGQWEEAEAAYRRALQRNPRHAPAWNNLGIVLRRQGRREESFPAFRRAIELDPQYADAWYNLGNAWRQGDRLDEARAAYERVLQLQPGHVSALNNLAMVLSDQGGLSAALDKFRHALQLAPKDSEVHSNIIMTLHFLHGHDRDELVREQQRWNQSFGSLPAAILPYPNDRDPSRPLRIGYVSADFRKHPVGWNMVPLLANHDRRSFEIICYSGALRPDEMTGLLRGSVDHWRETVHVTDDQLVEMIRHDRIDVLVDLSQHSAGNRLPVFARRPAPVQVSFAGYPETTGLDAIPGRISDRWLERDCRFSIADCQFGESCTRPEATEPTAWLRDLDQGHERVYLLDSFWCYDPCGVVLPVNELPAAAQGRVTFGCLNNFCKITEPMLSLWARVLEKVPGSQLLLLARPGSHRERMLKILSDAGVTRERVAFAEPRARAAYLELYHRVDIELDTYPYNGHTTSLDALWMGVPVVTLAGEQPVSRAGLSQLSNLGLADLVAASEDGYVETAATLAGDLPRLAELRRTLRPRMEHSVLMDAPRFARQIEAAYRAMWRHWCTVAEC